MEEQTQQQPPQQQHQQQLLPQNVRRTLSVSSRAAVNTVGQLKERFEQLEEALRKTTEVVSSQSSTIQVCARKNSRKGRRRQESGVAVRRTKYSCFQRWLVGMLLGLCGLKHTRLKY